MSGHSKHKLSHLQNVRTLETQALAVNPEMSTRARAKVDLSLKQRERLRSVAANGMIFQVDRESLRFECPDILEVRRTARHG